MSITIVFKENKLGARTLGARSRGSKSVTRLYWQQEWPMFSYYIYVVCSLYVTFLLPPERAPKVLAPSLFIIVQQSTVQCSTVQYITIPARVPMYGIWSDYGRSRTLNVWVEGSGLGE